MDFSENYIYQRQSRNTQLLRRLRACPDAYDAINLLAAEHPDVSMGLTVLLSLVQQGGTITFTGGRSNKIHEEWREFAARITPVGSTGLDGLLAQLHTNDFLYGGMGCEVVVKPDLSDVEDVYPISPVNLEWKLENREGKAQYIPYQNVNGKHIDLSKANFLWCPFMPKGENPSGTLLFKPAISAADMQLEFFSSSQKVLYRVGTPRYKVTVNKERLMASAPADVKQNPKKQAEYINMTFDAIKGNLSCIGSENDFITTDDTTIDTIGGDSSAYFQGIGAYADIIDVQMMNAVKCLGTLMNRRDSGSYALSTVEFKVIADMLESRQKAEKRIVEQIARIWLRVHGYNATVTYTPNPIEWQAMNDKITYRLKEQEYNRRAEEYGWISPDNAVAISGFGDSAYKEVANRCAYVKSVSDSADESNTENTENGSENE